MSLWLSAKFAGKVFGQQIVRESMQRSSNGFSRLILVLDESHYYSRFGFVTAGGYGLVWLGSKEMERVQPRELVDGYLAGL